jgi:hypothetical protein
MRPMDDEALKSWWDKMGLVGQDGAMAGLSTSGLLPRERGAGRNHSGFLSASCCPSFWGLAAHSVTPRSKTGAQDWVRTTHRQGNAMHRVCERAGDHCSRGGNKGSRQSSSRGQWQQEAFGGSPLPAVWSEPSILTKWRGPKLSSSVEFCPLASHAQADATPSFSPSPSGPAASATMTAPVPAIRERSPSACLTWAPLARDAPALPTPPAANAKGGGIVGSRVEAEVLQLRHNEWHSGCGSLPHSPPPSSPAPASKGSPTTEPQK